MTYPKVVFDALTEKLVSLEKNIDDTIKEWDERNSETANRYLDHLECFFETESSDFEGFIRFKRIQINSAKNNDLKSKIEDAIDIIDYMLSIINSPNLKSFHGDLIEMLQETK